MCGIAGIISLNSGLIKNNLKKMASVLVHRGPDAEGFFYFNECALAHRRLSIVGIDTGAQPMLTSDNKVGVTFNGEIYGYNKIKERFVDYDFKTDSDTEIILALYKRYGINFLEHLPGMFAFALWDDNKKELICARDRFGEKPFYYAFGKNGEFLFASEIKAIIASGLIEPVLDRGSVAHFLKHLYVHPSKTIYKNIFILPAAHRLIYKDGNITINRYWNFPEVNVSLSLDDTLLRFKELLDNAVKKQLVADVPVGAFLSGGLDSSTIVALASRFKPGLKTFSFAFRDSINELPYARLVANKYKTEHIELFDDSDDIAGLFLKMQEVYDEPFADSSNIPMYMISKLARRHLKVVLTGDGGDELFGGYGWYKPFLYNNKFFRHDFVYLLGRILRRLVGNNLLIQKHLGAKFNINFSSPVEAHLCGQETVFSDSDLQGFGMGSIIDSDKIDWMKSGNLDDVMKLDVRKYMAGDILVKVDRASMANGVELRAPFLDVDFATFCLNLPYNLKINSKEDKIILRRAYSEKLPLKILKRNKQGFGAPVEKWLKDKAMRDLKQEYLSNPKNKIYDLISYEKAQPFINMGNYKTWALLTLSVWIDRNKKYGLRETSSNKK